MYERRWKDNNLKYSWGNERKLKSKRRIECLRAIYRHDEHQFRIKRSNYLSRRSFSLLFARSYQCVKLRLDIKASENPSSCITEKIHLINLHLHWAENNSLLTAEPGWKSQENIKPFSRGSRRGGKKQKKIKGNKFPQGSIGWRR